MASKQALRVAIAGTGTVGGGLALPAGLAATGDGCVAGGVANILLNEAPMIAQRCGRPVTLVGLADLQKPNIDADISHVKWYSDAVEMARTSEADVVVETIGGTTIAKSCVEAALSTGKHVATANKALLAENAHSIGTLAQDNGCNVAFEAAVAGGIPVIKALREGLAANSIQSVQGIMNGTCNFILTTMRESGRAFDDVLQEAQAKGYAETPPDLDVDGIDTAHKLTLLTTLAYGTTPSFDQEGIRNVSSVDVDMAGAAGYKIKLLGIADTNETGQISQRVYPALVPHDSMLAPIEGVTNAVMLEGNYVGNTMYVGPGAGRDATASAVVADIIDIARGNTMDTFRAPLSQLSTREAAPIATRTGAYFIRSIDNGLAEALERHGIPTAQTAQPQGAQNHENALLSSLIRSAGNTVGVFTSTTIEHKLVDALAGLPASSLNGPRGSVLM